MLTDTLHYVTIELPKFNKDIEELDSPLDNMLFLFRNLGEMKEIPAYFKDKNLDRLFETTMFANMTPELQDRYFREFMYEMDQKSRMRTAHEDGITEGEAKAMEKTAKAMKAKHYDISEIIEITGLTEEQINDL